ncbi:MAG TPA: hypothetical protein ENL27_00735, partial [Candidatus Parcubacteria bacterium]|nr:hypothetical protein [Candidatus Parcubacteria bacterium]
FKSRLKKGSRGKEVEELQKCLSAPSAGKFYNEKITGYFGEKTKQAVIKFQEKFAKEILEPWGYEKGTGIVGESTRKKLNEICFPTKNESLYLKFTLTTVDEPQLSEVAEILKEQWKNIGVSLEIKKLPLPKLEQESLKPRNYQLLLFGEALGAIPDPLPFWHSSQKIDPGLNIALYSNKKADTLLEENRLLADPKKREEKLENFQNLIIQDAAAVFLYSPDYIYVVSKKVKGINTKKIANPSKRFVGIENWYLKTKRVWR